MLKLTTDKHEASRGLSATAELLVLGHFTFRLSLSLRPKTKRLKLGLSPEFAAAQKHCSQGHSLTSSPTSSLISLYFFVYF